MTSKLLLIAAAAWFSLGSVLAQTIQIPEQVEVDQESLVLGDIASIQPRSSSLANVPLGYAPYPGHHRWLQRAEVERVLRKWGISSKVRLDMEDRVLVTRKSQVVEAETIRQAVQTFLKGFRPDLDFTIHEIQLPQDIVLPMGTIEIVVDPPAALSILNGLSLKVDFHVDGERHKSQWVRVNAVASGEAVTLARDLPYGHRVQPSDLTLESLEMDRLEDFFTSPDEAVGTVSKKALKQGQPLGKKDVRQPEMVKRGDVVTLVARGSSFTVSTSGKARDSGSRGDSVMVENLDSKELVRATVIGEKMVQVQVPEVTR